MVGMLDVIVTFQNGADLKATVKTSFLDFSGIRTVRRRTHRTTNDSIRKRLLGRRNKHYLKGNIADFQKKSEEVVHFFIVYISTGVCRFKFHRVSSRFELSRVRVPEVKFSSTRQ